VYWYGGSAVVRRSGEWIEEERWWLM